MKLKLTALALAILMLLSLTACTNTVEPNGENENTGTAATENAESSAANTTTSNAKSIYYAVTNIEPEEIAFTLDGNDIPSEMYCYWAAFNCSAIEYQVKLYHDYYGLYEEMLDEDGNINWDAEFSSGTTLNEYVKQMTEETMRFYAAVENLAAKYNVSLTEANLESIEEERLSMVEDLGGEDEFENYLVETGLSRTNFDRIMAASSLIDNLIELAKTEGSEIYLAPEKYDDYMMYADHILLMTVDSSTGEELGVKEKAAKLEKAEEILEELRSADDLAAKFRELADENSEDTGRETNPNGYFFSDGDMISEFETAVKSLKAGEISDIVESQYGYHIILRKDLQEGLSENSDKLDELLEDYVVSVVNAYQVEMELTTHNALADMELGPFYNDYLDKMNTLKVANAVDTLTEAAESESSSSKESTEGSGN